MSVVWCRVLLLAAAMSDSEDELSFESVEEADEEKISGNSTYLLCVQILCSKVFEP